MLVDLHAASADQMADQIKQIQMAAIQNKNIFEELMEVSKTASLGQITNCLFEVGGQYRRNM
jgi:methylmalonyl-CoA mutase